MLTLIKVRLTYVRGSEEEQVLIDKLNECFEVINISKVYQGRGSSKFDNIYIDLEVNEKKK